MPTPKVAEILAAIEALPDEERRELDDLLWNRLSSQVRITKPPPATPESIERFLAWKPITLPGGPLSDDIIRDRR